jgi:hypothetical protein
VLTKRLLGLAVAVTLLATALNGGAAGRPAARLLSRALLNPAHTGGRQIEATALLDHAGQIRAQYRDVSSGRALSVKEVNEILHAVAARQSSNCDKLDAFLCNLSQQVQTGSVSARTRWPVMIWVNAPPLEPIHQRVRDSFPEVTFEEGIAPQSDVTLSELRAIRRAFHAGMKEAHAPSLSNALVRLQQAGIRLTRVRHNSLAPIILASVAASDLKALGRLTYVLRVHANHWEPEKQLWSSSRTQQTKRAWDQGWLGNDVLVAIVDANNFDKDHPALAPLYAGTRLSNAPKDNHATRVAGAVGNTYSANYDRGVAPSARLLNAGVDWDNPSIDKGQDMIDAALWGVEHLAEAMNLSMGSNNTLQRIGSDDFFDWLVHVYRVPISVVAGNFDNCAGGSSGDIRPQQESPPGEFVCTAVMSPGKAWNVLTVGGIDDKNTPGSWTDESKWLDDTLYEFSSWSDPSSLHQDRDKPEVSASAVGVGSPSSYGGVDQASGTSYAAPQVAGTYALIGAQVPALLAAPRTLRALIMANAWRRTDVSCGPSVGICEREGVATLDPWKAVQGAVNGRYATGYLDGVSCAGGYCAPTSCKTHTASFQHGPVLEPGGTHLRRVHVSLNWEAKAETDGVGGWNVWLGADLDLQVVAPSGATVASASFDNNFEEVRFIPAESGTYTMKVCAKSVGWTNTTNRKYYSVAWDNPDW